MRSRCFQVGILFVAVAFVASASSSVSASVASKTTKTVSAVQSSSSSPSFVPDGGVQDAAEVERYASLPATVFAPSGRLRGIERVTRDAFFFQDAADSSSCVAFALLCGGGGRRRIHGGGIGDDEDCAVEEEYAVMVGVGARSPYLHTGGGDDNDDDDESLSTHCRKVRGREGGENSAEDCYSDRKATNARRCVPLAVDDWDDDECGSDGLPSSAMPIAVLSPSVLVGVGGRGVDSAVLLRRTAEAALSMYSSDNGGTEWFLSHAAERDLPFNRGKGAAASAATPPPAGGVVGVESAVLARRVADMAQSSMQSLGGKHGRVLSSSVLVVGANQKNRCGRKEINHRDDGDDNCDDDNDSIAIWRVSPTGQFCRADAAAVGRGAFDVEAKFMSVVKKWKDELRRRECRKGQVSGAGDFIPLEIEESAGDDNSDVISNVNVREYLNSLSMDEALSVAAECLLDGILTSSRGTTSGVIGGAEEKIIARNMLRKRIRASILRFDSSRRPECIVEVVR